MEEEFVGTGRWQYANAVGRLPLYLLGMLCAIKNKENLSYKVTVPLFLLSIVFFFQNQHYLFSACATPFLMQVANKIIDRSTLFQKSAFTWIGAHTLELYCGNTITAEIVVHFFHPDVPLFTKLAIDFALTFVLSITLWRVNIKIQKSL